MEQSELEDNLTFSMNCTQFAAFQTTDTVQIGYQLVAALIGLPLNIFVFLRLATALNKDYSRILALHLLLNTSNILILIVYSLLHSLWQIGFWWPLGNCSCKIYKFLSTFVFYLSSNAAVSIAVDLHSSVFFPLFTRRFGRERVNILIVGSTVAAALMSIPQLFVWALDSVYCEDVRVWLSQCSYMLSDPYWTIVYSTAHNVAVFWLPLALITPLYAAVTLQVWRHFRFGAPEARMCGETESDAILHCRGCHRATSTGHLANSEELRRSFGSQQVVRSNKAKIIRSSSTIVVVYVISWLPYQISSFYTIFKPDELDVHAILWCCEALMIFGTLVNPFLYRYIVRRRSARESKTLPPLRVRWKNRSVESRGQFAESGGSEAPSPTDL